jgi:alpha-L-fucosidase
VPVQPVNYEPTWDSLAGHRVPDWYQDGKFGIFIHWGVYSVPAFGNEWYPRNMYLKSSPEYGHHVKTYGPPARFGYKDFIPMFKAEKYDPGHWAQLFKNAGARYVVPVAEHHDGFAMYDSALTRWNAARMGPRRDVLGELAQAVRQQGLIFGLSSHRAEHWWFMNGGREFDSDVGDPQYADFYGPAVPVRGERASKDWQPRPDAKYLDDWLSRTSELVEKYQPQLIWFDWWIEQIVFEPYLQKFAAFYYNKGLEWDLGVTINYKNQSFPEGAAVLDIERGQLKEIRPQFWQTDTSISKNSWGYVLHQEYKTAEAIIGDLVDIVSKNGALLLNIGPRPDGSIPEEEEAILLEIGRWLQVNGEAIYGTRPWAVFGEGPTQVNEGSFTDTQRAAFTAEDLRFTRKGNALYVLALARPEGELLIRSLDPGSPVQAAHIQQISLLGMPGGLAWSQDEAGLHVQNPARMPAQPVYAFKVELQALF